jgi:uncharacterized protein YcfJ
LKLQHTKEIAMKRHATLIIILSLLINLPAAASHRDRDEDRGRGRWAKVLHSTPAFERVRVVTPVRECWTERVAYERSQQRRHRRHHSTTPTVVGATIGGLLGRELGHGRHDRRVATVIGAVLGGSIGHDIGHRHGRNRRHDRRHRNVVRYRNEQRCEMRDVVAYERRVVGYDVEYKYRGRIYQTRMGNDPGRRIKVEVDVKPIH